MPDLTPDYEYAQDYTADDQNKMDAWADRGSATSQEDPGVQNRYERNAPPERRGMPEPPPPAVYGFPSDLLRRKLEDKLGWLEDQRDEGNLLDEHVAGPMQRIQARLAKLNARKDAVEGQGQQKAQQQAMQETAFQQAVKMQHYKAEADDIPDRVRPFDDPFTGKRRYMTVNSKGDVEVLDMGEDSPATPLLGGGIVSPETVAQIGLGANPEAAPASLPTQTQPQPGDHTMTIQNGANIERVHYRGNQIAGREVYDPQTGTWGVPQQQGQGAQGERGTLTPSEHAALDKQAFDNVSRYYRPGTRAFYDALEREQHLLKGRLLQSRNDAAKEAASAGAADKAVEARKSAADAKTQSDKDKADRLSKHRDAVNHDAAMMDKIHSHLLHNDEFKAKPYEEQIKEVKKQFLNTHGYEPRLGLHPEESGGGVEEGKKILDILKARGQVAPGGSAVAQPPQPVANPDTSSIPGGAGYGAGASLLPPSGPKTIEEVNAARKKRGLPPIRPDEQGSEFYNSIRDMMGVRRQ